MSLLSRLSNALSNTLSSKQWIADYAAAREGDEGLMITGNTTLQSENGMAFVKGDPLDIRHPMRGNALSTRKTVTNRSGTKTYVTWDTIADGDIASSVLKRDSPEFESTWRAVRSAKDSGFVDVPCHMTVSVKTRDWAAFKSLDADQAAPVPIFVAYLMYKPKSGRPLPSYDDIRAVMTAQGEGLAVPPSYDEAVGSSRNDPPPSP